MTGRLRLLWSTYPQPLFQSSRSYKVISFTAQSKHCLCGRRSFIYSWQQFLGGKRVKNFGIRSDTQVVPGLAVITGRVRKSLGAAGRRSRPLRITLPQAGGSFSGEAASVAGCTLPGEPYSIRRPNLRVGCRERRQKDSSQIINLTKEAIR